MQWPCPRRVLAMVSRSSRLLQTPTAEASSPAYRWTNPGISPVANSACTRSSNSRMVRIIRYTSSRRSRVRAFRSTVSVMCTSLDVGVDRTKISGGTSEQAEAGAGGQDRGHVHAPGPVGPQPDGRLVARPEGELALAVHGDDAGPRVDAMSRAGAHRLDLAHPDRHDQARRDRGEHLAGRAGGEARGDPVRFA